MGVTRIPYNTRHHEAFRAICNENPSEAEDGYARFADAYRRFETKSDSYSLSSFKSWLRNDNCPNLPPPPPIKVSDTSEKPTSFESPSWDASRVQVSPQAARTVGFGALTLGVIATTAKFGFRFSPLGLALTGVGVLIDAGKNYRLDMKIAAGGGA